MASITIQNRTEAGGATQISPRQKRAFGILQNDSGYDIVFGFDSGVTFAHGPHSGIKLAAGKSISFPELALASGSNDFALYACHNEADGTDPQVRFIQR